MSPPVKKVPKAKIVSVSGNGIDEWWEKLDLNQRSLSATDLQSAPFDQTQAFSHIGGLSRNRTWDAQIFSLPLYQLS